MLVNTRRRRAPLGVVPPSDTGAQEQSPPKQSARIPSVSLRGGLGMDFPRTAALKQRATKLQHRIVGGGSSSNGKGAHSPKGREVLIPVVDENAVQESKSKRPPSPPEDSNEEAGEASDDRGTSDSSKSTNLGNNRGCVFSSHKIE